jgi:peptidoglycan/xylan/chitin deacetylase (PgdA/CDA1 family)
MTKNKVQFYSSMTGKSKIRGKRELLAKGLLWSGASFVMSQFPPADSLLVLNYHRIGHPEKDLYDPGVFSATADQLDDQITFLKKQASLVTLEDALAFVEGRVRKKRHRFRVLITFDDGYRDNYDLAFPILRSHGVQAVFFLATGIVGSAHIPWWDHIAYLMRTARRRRFSLRYPENREIDLERHGLEDALRSVLRLFKLPENSDSARFMIDLQEATQGDDPPAGLRRFLDWHEAREMISGGMAFGSHTHSHGVLSQLEPARQREELMVSRSMLQEQLGISADVLAYPVGAKTSFSDATQKIAREAGYRAAFSHHGGKNIPASFAAYDIKRQKVGGQSWERFKVQTVICKFSASHWP